MPKAGSRSSRHARSSHPTSLDIHRCSVEQLTRLPAEVLRLHLSSKHLITTGTKAVMARRLYRAIHNIDETSPIVSTQPSSSTTTSATTASPPITTQSSVPPRTSVPAALALPTTSSPGSHTTSLSDVAARVSLQPELQSQFSSIMSQLVQLATASAEGNLSPASTVDAPPQLPLTDIPPFIPPTCRANPVSNTWQVPNYLQSSTLPMITTTSYPPNSLFPVVSSTTQLLNYTSSHIPATNYSPSSTLPPVPVQLRQQILQGEYVDFAMLLHKATFSDVLEVHASSRQPVIKPITSFDTWMQAWNLYLSVLLGHNPSRAVELSGYQRLICSANTLLPVRSWLQYDSKFRTLAAADPLLRWDQRHPDLWLECLASVQQNAKRWPCPYCSGTNHFPSNCLQAPFRQKQDSPDHSRTSDHLKRSSHPICGMFNQGHCSRQACSYQHICLSCEGKHTRAFCPGRKTSSR